MFTLHNNSSSSGSGSSGSKKHKGSDNNSVYGLFLLSINLLLDGVTNSTQDYLFASARGLVSGPQMQCGLNVFGFILTMGFLVGNPWSSELRDAVMFVKENPGVAGDVVGFALCGAVGQVFICMFYSSSSPFAISPSFNSSTILPSLFTTLPFFLKVHFLSNKLL